ncbi:MAG TPA: hypothetical protein VLM05_12660, partial [Mycobacteriales bacterium]|nr:hypothetical protein [Mycobacteriales bacterium]
MTTREFPALGFDPAPGDPGALSSAAADVAGTGKVFGDASANVSRLNSSGWTGDAADAFRSQLKDLPRDLDLAARSHQTAARALSDYQSGLVSRQRRAAELEAQAAELRRREQSAVAEVNRLAGQTAPSGSPEFARLKSQYDSARSTATTLGSELQDVIAQARRLHGEHTSAASTAAGTIRDVADAPYKEPGWLSRAWSSVKGWIADHADVLEKISAVLKGVSAVLGVLSLVPGLQFLAPFALLTAGAALAIDVALKVATGKGSWVSIGIDAALTFLPAGKILSGLKGVKAAVAGEKGAVAAERALAAGDDAAKLLKEGDDLGRTLDEVWPPPKLEGGNPLPTKPMQTGFEGEHLPGNSIWGTEVKYLDDAGRESYRVIPRDGKLVDVNGNPFDTTAGVTHWSGDGRAIYVMDEQ